MTGRYDSPKEIYRSEIREGCIPEIYIDDRNTLFKKICHGDPSRSLFFRNRLMPLCARCLGFYLFLGISIFVFSVIYVLFDPGSLLVLLITLLLILPMVADGYTQYLGWRVSNNTLRFITGGLGGLGSGAAFVYLVFRITT